MLRIKRKWGHYREISERGLDVLTERWQGQYIIDLTDEFNKLFII